MPHSELFTVEKAHCAICFLLGKPGEKDDRSAMPWREKTVGNYTKRARGSGDFA